MEGKFKRRFPQEGLTTGILSWVKQYLERPHLGPPHVLARQRICKPVGEETLF